MGTQITSYKAEPALDRIVHSLDMMTLIYQRRSGITHIVADPVPQILDVMGDMPCDVALISARISNPPEKATKSVMIKTPIANHFP